MSVWRDPEFWEAFFWVLAWFAGVFVCIGLFVKAVVADEMNRGAK